MHPQTLISFVLINTILAVLLMVPRNIALGQHKDILTLADASQCGLRNHLIVFHYLGDVLKMKETFPQEYL